LESSEGLDHSKGGVENRRDHEKKEKRGGKEKKTKNSLLKKEIAE
jgi:hypothetical protein